MAGSSIQAVSSCPRDVDWFVWWTVCAFTPCAQHWMLILEICGTSPIPFSGIEEKCTPSAWEIWWSPFMLACRICSNWWGCKIHSLAFSRSCWQSFGFLTSASRFYWADRFVWRIIALQAGNLIARQSTFKMQRIANCAVRASATRPWSISCLKSMPNFALNSQPLQFANSNYDQTWEYANSWRCCIVRWRICEDWALGVCSSYPACFWQEGWTRPFAPLLILLESLAVWNAGNFR